MIHVDRSTSSSVIPLIERLGEKEVKTVKHKLKQACPLPSPLHYYSVSLGHVSLNRILKYFHHDLYAHGRCTTELEVKDHTAFSLLGPKNNVQSHESSTFHFLFQTASIQGNDEKDVTLAYRVKSLGAYTLWGFKISNLSNFI